MENDINFGNINTDCMKEEYARQIVEWNYKEKYSEYNLPTYDECLEKNYGITRKNQKDNYIVYVLDGEVVFYSNMKLMDNNEVYIGVGLKPKYCGKGLGFYFINDSIKKIQNKYPKSVLYLEVRSWNKRAIKSYQKNGFNITDTIIKKDRLGNDTEFVVMKRS